MPTNIFSHKKRLASKLLFTENSWITFLNQKIKIALKKWFHCVSTREVSGTDDLWLFQTTAIKTCLVCTETFRSRALYRNILGNISLYIQVPSSQGWKWWSQTTFSGLECMQIPLQNQFKINKNVCYDTFKYICSNYPNLNLVMKSIFQARFRTTNNF